MVNDLTILSDIKTTLDFASDEDTGFDSRLILEIDGVVGELSQLTYVDDSFVMTAESKWSQLMKYNDPFSLRLAKQYIYTAIRIKFDPPTGSVLTSLEKALSSTAHRLIIQKESFNEPTD